MTWWDIVLLGEISGGNWTGIAIRKAGIVRIMK